ncbi:MAG: MlaD family protein [Myxococcota bacterium]|nr:MlaD family protein [Myxococcota bacterium]MDW8361684.1 MlaD family protein [Myxococcales bacterium]
MSAARATDVRVGIFVLAALAVGGGVAFVIGNRQNLFASKTEYRAVFDSVGGLRAGSPVRIGGVDVGTVSAVRLGEDGRIHVELGIVDSAAHLVCTDSVATVGNKGLLGDRLVDITAGRGPRLPPGGTLRTESPVDIGAYAARLGGMLGRLEGVVDNVREATAILADPQLGADVRAVARHLASLLEAADAADGPVRRLLTDPAVGENLAASVAHARTASAEAARAAASMRAILDEVRSGEGTAHELVYGREGVRLVRALADVGERTGELLRQAREGEGLLHEMLYGDAGGRIAGNLASASEHLEAILRDVRAGRGTLGGLLTDPSIYEDIKRLVGDLERNEILRALVRYSIRHDEARPRTQVRPSSGP